MLVSFEAMFQTSVDVDKFRRDEGMQLEGKTEWKVRFAGPFPGSKSDAEIDAITAAITESVAAKLNGFIGEAEGYFTWIPAENGNAGVVRIDQLYVYLFGACEKPMLYCCADSGFASSSLEISPADSEDDWMKVDVQKD
jgi:hypothetical protein